ncbi:hypothetical protein QYM36_004015, partial [Artemia franciscana]
MEWSMVEEWLDSHPEKAYNYFLKFADVTLINRWLQARGYLKVPDGLNGSVRSSSGHTLSPSSFYCSRDQSPCSPLSPRDRSPQDSVAFFGDEGENPHRRTNSRKCSRHEFAKSKSQSVVKAEEGSSSRPKESGISQVRRTGLKEIRKSVSLPPSSIGLLSLLIESK